MCKLHAGGKVSLIQLRREAQQLGPMVIDTVEEIIMGGENDLVRIAAAKLWTEIVGIKDAPPVGAGLEEEELEAARRSLSRKLESVAERVLQRKTA